MSDSVDDEIDDASFELLPLRQPKSYRSPLILRVIWTVLFGAVIGAEMGDILRSVLYLVATTNPGIHVVDIVGTFVELVVLVFIYGLLDSPRLTLSERGITYSELVFSLSCNWDDIKSIVKIWTRMGFSYDIVLRRSKLRAVKGLAGLIKLIGLDRRVPLSRFDLSWRDGELGAYLHYYAPFLNLNIE